MQASPLPTRVRPNPSSSGRSKNLTVGKAYLSSEAGAKTKKRERCGWSRQHSSSPSSQHSPPLPPFLHRISFQISFSACGKVKVASTTKKRKAGRRERKNFLSSPFPLLSSYFHKFTSSSSASSTKLRFFQKYCVTNSCGRRKKF